MDDLLIGAAGALGGLVLGALGGVRFARRSDIPSSALDPKPAPAADHRHRWHDRPFLHDPAGRRYLYACQHTSCRAQLRSRKLLKALPEDDA